LLALPLNIHNVRPAPASDLRLRSEVAIREAFLASPKSPETSQPRTEAPQWRTAQWCALGALGVAIITWAGFHLEFNFAAASLCYLLLIVLQSLTGDFVASCFVSLVALGSLDYFFTSPILSFRVGHPINILALSCFLVTALVITSLVATVREKAELSYAQQQKTQQLDEVAQHLLAADPRGIRRALLRTISWSVWRQSCMFT
jgi:K+-sensing histidine kinase KdpD